MLPRQAGLTTVNPPQTRARRHIRRHCGQATAGASGKPCVHPACRQNRICVEWISVYFEPDQLSIWNRVNGSQVV
jgi:hypothetical protein